ncbi:hypothetical protein FDENT_11378 [Fusarium denticulatum]|uniref:Myb-like domain-containing protein n=1 Tax=Fusarium denticulatum TaxID=48507 RepID=A0A8H5TI25_9HYPO|nr:hypothetical protein FDENT_11378 [Fusarium denticulatum]
MMALASVKTLLYPCQAFGRARMKIERRSLNQCMSKIIYDLVSMTDHIFISPWIEFFVTFWDESEQYLLFFIVNRATRCSILSLSMTLVIAFSAIGILSQLAYTLPRLPAPFEAQTRLEEWPLTGVFLKCITEGGKTTFQLQFEWKPDSCQLHAAKSASLPTKRKRLTSTLRSASKSSSRGRSSQDNCFTPVLDSIRVAVDGMSDASNDDDSSNSSNFEDDSDRDRAPRPHTFHCKKTKRRRWTTEEEDLLRQLKQSQQGNGMLSDMEIAMKLDRTESSVKQHWDVMGRKQE